MIVFSFLTILLRCFSYIESVNSNTLRNSYSYGDYDDYGDFLQLYKIVKQHQQEQQQYKRQPNQITNNIYFIPMPLLIPKIILNKEEKPKVSQDNQAFDQKFEAAFRDTEGTNVFKQLDNNNPLQINRKSMKKSSSRILFEPSMHRNWDLLPQMCGQGSTSDRITGGENATLGQYPWMARIGYINVALNKSTPNFRCGGSLITKNHVITAAHCVVYLPPELSVGIVRLGEYNTETPFDCQDHRCADKVVDVKPKSITVHENYGTPNARNDIALIQLKDSVTFTEWVTPICLPDGELMTKDYTNQKGEVAGWGFYDISINKGSTILQTVQLPILKIQPCAKAFHGVQIHYKKQLCVGGDLGKDSCNGDSGGPLMKVVSIDNEPKYVLLGIVSLGAKYCGLTAAPAIYTKITYYMEWILDHLV